MVGLLVAMGLAAPSALAAGTAEVPWQAIAANLKTHRVITNFDQASFAGATARYPVSQGDGNVAVLVGRYLMWKLVGLFTSDQRVEQIRLSSFVMSCRPSKAAFATEVICDLNAALLVRDQGSTRVIDISTNRNVGRLFDSKNADYATVIY
ncbi:MAG: hypothetical protein ACM3N5_17000, partial [Candidatus Eiseniibacteriota bacterium]